ncbi:tRNA 2-thiouridine(34) synthase MnmA [Phocaeicola coprophilus]|uniref:tRNA 2-thiouridine(34) synthase MnmA n=1 Tax=Phocaeicola coprophilus TaxID=387090 RepID=UPI003AB32A20
MNLAALISGGVDSAVAVHLLCEQGYKPDLFYIRIGMDTDDGLSCTAEEDIELATATARKYGLKLEVVDLQQEYWDRVVAYTIDKVRQGFTPNPDVMCNKLIKFGCFEEKAGHAYDRIATGHYASTCEREGKVWLATAKDPVKDQTDFLAQIDYLQVSRLLFPLGGLMKQEVRETALAARLPSARRKDSQGICFLGKINYNDFIRRFLGERPGAIVELESGREIGTHKGFWFHTIGQRKGLGLSGGPWFVVDKDPEKNLLFVSRGYDTVHQYGRKFRLTDFHFITENPWPEAGEQEICFKIRHTDQFLPGVIRPAGTGYEVESPYLIQGIAPGQFGVIYDREARLCIGSGEIRRCPE